MTDYLECEHCHVVALNVTRVAIAVTTGSKNMPYTAQSDLCHDCRSGLETVIREALR
jgi:NAD-dependent dihydropyrimidine dehydrogenase PreA subunit